MASTSSIQETTLLHPFRFAAGYTVLLVAAVVVFLGIRWIGESTFVVTAATATAETQTAAGHGSSNLLTGVITALVVVVLTGRVLGSLFVYIGQPRVIGEVVAGIMLGPSLLGQISTPTMESLFPTTIMPTLGVLAQLGVILYMFLVGLELNAELIRKRAHVTVAISHASIVAPFVLGSAIALWLYPQFAPAGVKFTNFALFLGVAMAITAFPVLARILTDRKMDQTELGVIALSCAAADDVTAWCLLAFVVGVAQADVLDSLNTVGLSIAFLAFMFIAVRPLLRHWIRRDEAQKGTSSQLTAWVLLAVLACALTTERIGIHAIFGAFLLGAVIPHDSGLARSFRQKLEDVVSILLLPTFFAYTGMKTQIGLLSNPYDWLVCAVIILVATLGKFGGTILAGRSAGMPWRQSAALGVLMNTRGLMELIVLNIGLELGVISPRLFAMMVIMALVTTIATTPILARLVKTSPATV